MPPESMQNPPCWLKREREQRHRQTSTMHVTSSEKSVIETEVHCVRDQEESTGEEEAGKKAGDQTQRILILP